MMVVLNSFKLAGNKRFSTWHRVANKVSYLYTGSSQLIANHRECIMYKAPPNYRDAQEGWA